LIWDLDVRRLRDQHLLGEHRELYGVWTVVTTGKRGCDCVTSAAA
jgi:hypothetical protein